MVYVIYFYNYIQIYFRNVFVTNESSLGEDVTTGNDNGGYKLPMKSHGDASSS